MLSESQTRILVIDDDDAVRESFRNFLEDHDYIVCEATNGREGLERFEAESPDVVMVDLRMPELDGLQLLEKLAKRFPKIPLIVVSATGQIDDAVEAMHLGAWDYLLKPVTDLSLLEQAIVKALERVDAVERHNRQVSDLQQQVDTLLAELGREPRYCIPDTGKEDSDLNG